ncbi:MAG: hypothetical protein CMN73_08225, partial [Sphingomonas sp.]|nr:hypothetical protein [Sphingomonas sp.]
MTADFHRPIRGFDPGKLAEIRPALERFVASGELAGIVTLTARGSDIVQSDAIGWADIELRRPMLPDTLFRIASMSKPISSVAAMMLIEEGRIALDDPVTRWIPELAERMVLRDPTGPLDNIVPA